MSRLRLDPSPVSDRKPNSENGGAASSLHPAKDAAAGAVAKLLTPGRDPGGWLITILLGIGGSVLAHFIGRSLGWYGEGDAAGFIASVVGAIILLLLYRLVFKRSHSRG